MTFKIKPKLTGLAALLEEQERAKREAGTLTTTAPPKTPETLAREENGYVEPELAKERISIIFDDSGSMDSGQKIKDARDGCKEFLRYCGKNQVAVAVYPMNLEPLALDTNLPALAALIDHIAATGGTPMFTTLSKAQKAEIKATRFIIFSDGQPTDNNNNSEHVSNMETCIKVAIEAKTPIDTVYISSGRPFDSEVAIMKEIAERTGGFFLIFDRNKVNFGQAFKFLAPGLRLQLASESFRQELQEGKI